MAIIHKARVSPTRTELLERIFGGSVTVLGTYRLDDPGGEVGIEAFIVCYGAELRQVVLTYRGARLEGAEEDLISTMEHSVLGRRWIYDGTGDPVALAGFQRVLRGEQEQAVEELWDNGQRVGTVEPSVRLSLAPGRPPEADAAPVIARDLDDEPEHAQGPYLRAEWSCGRAIVASIG